MKKRIKGRVSKPSLIIVFCLSLTCISLHAQQADPLKKIHASFGSGGLASGQIPISTTLYTLKGRGFNIPITLNYNPNVKLDQPASPFGVGWNESSFGGVTRALNSVPDEAYYGYSCMWRYQSPEDVILDNPNDDIPARRSRDLDQHYASIGCLDVAPDIFSFNVPSCNGGANITGQAFWANKPGEAMQFKVVSKHHVDITPIFEDPERECYDDVRRPPVLPSEIDNGSSRQIPTDQYAPIVGFKIIAEGCEYEVMAATLYAKDEENSVNDSRLHPLNLDLIPEDVPEDEDNPKAEYFTESDEFFEDICSINYYETRGIVTGWKTTKIINLNSLDSLVIDYHDIKYRSRYLSNSSVDYLIKPRLSREFGQSLHARILKGLGTTKINESIHQDKVLASARLVQSNGSSDSPDNDNYVEVGFMLDHSQNRKDVFLAENEIEMNKVLGLRVFRQTKDKGRFIEFEKRFGLSYSTGKLTLDSIYQTEPLGLRIPAEIFTYHGKIPRKKDASMNFSAAKDIAGFYNGKDNMKDIWIAHGDQRYHIPWLLPKSQFYVSNSKIFESIIVPEGDRPKNWVDRDSSQLIFMDPFEDRSGVESYKKWYASFGDESTSILTFRDDKYEGLYTNRGLKWDVSNHALRIPFQLLPTEADRRPDEQAMLNGTLESYITSGGEKISFEWESHQHRFINNDVVPKFNEILKYRYEQPGQMTMDFDASSGSYVLHMIQGLEMEDGESNTDGNTVQLFKQRRTDPDSWEVIRTYSNFEDEVDTLDLEPGMYKVVSSSPKNMINVYLGKIATFPAPRKGLGLRIKNLVLFPYSKWTRIPSITCTSTPYATLKTHEFSLFNDGNLRLTGLVDQLTIVEREDNGGADAPLDTYIKVVKIDDAEDVEVYFKSWEAGNVEGFYEDLNELISLEGGQYRLEVFSGQYAHSFYSIEVYPAFEEHQQPERTFNFSYSKGIASYPSNISTAYYVSQSSENDMENQSVNFYDENYSNETTTNTRIFFGSESVLANAVVQYSDVTITENDGEYGFYRSEFTTALDFPDEYRKENYDQIPFLGTSYAFKRGLLKARIQYDAEGNALDTVKSEYEFYSERVPVYNMVRTNFLKFNEELNDFMDRGNPDEGFYDLQVGYALPIKTNAKTKLLDGSWGGTPTTYTWKPNKKDRSEVYSRNSLGAYEFKKIQYLNDYETDEDINALLEQNQMQIPAFQTTHMHDEDQGFKILDASKTEYKVLYNLRGTGHRAIVPKATWQGFFPEGFYRHPENHREEIEEQMVRQTEFVRYDEYLLRPTLVRSYDGTKTIFIYDQGVDRVAAKVIIPQTNEVGNLAYYQGFEGPDRYGDSSVGYVASNWWNKTKTGAHYKQLDLNEIYSFYPDLNRTSDYILTYWKTIGRDEDGKLIENPEWELVEVALNDYDGSRINIPGNSDAHLFIDEIRIHPKDAYMVTYSYDGEGKLISTMDENLFTTHFVYDDLDRQISTWNDKGYLLSYTEYYYAGTQLSKSNPNYIRYYTANSLEFRTVEAMLEAQADPAKVSVFTKYLDGAGRTIQLVSRLAGIADGNDLVQPYKYDKFGNTPTIYLPYMAYSNNGGFRPNALEDQGGNYEGSEQWLWHQNASIENKENSQVPYSELITENAPRQLAMETSQPSTHYQLGSGHTTTFNSGFVRENEVRIWKEENGRIKSDGYYERGTLTKQKIRQPDGSGIWVYVNRMGKPVLSIVEGNGSPPELMHTAYVYDEFDQLKAIIPPRQYRELINSQN